MPCSVLPLKHDGCRDMQVVIEKLQAGAQKAQAVACKLEAPQTSAQGEEALVSADACHRGVHTSAWSCISF